MRLNVVKLAAVMKEKDLRQKDIVHRTGISRNTVSAKKKKKSCSEDTAVKIAEALGIALGDLIEKEERGKK